MADEISSAPSRTPAQVDWGYAPAPEARAAGGRGLLLHVDHDHRDVVVAAGVEGRGEEVASRPFWIFRRLQQDLRDPRLRDHVGEPIRTEQHPVARLCGQHCGVDVDVIVGA